MTTMKRKDYEKPTMKVVKLQQTGMLMTSNGNAGVQDYTTHDYYEE
jgi:hypothetical protein